MTPAPAISTAAADGQDTSSAVRTSSVDSVDSANGTSTASSNLHMLASSAATSAASSAAARSNSTDSTEERLKDSLVAWGELRKISREVGTFVISARLAKRSQPSEEDKQRKRQRTDTENAATAGSGSSGAQHHPPAGAGFNQQRQARLKKMMDCFVVMQRAQEAFEKEIQTTIEDWKEEDKEGGKSASK